MAGLLIQGESPGMSPEMLAGTTASKTQRCVGCGNEFVSGRRRQYCSQRCRRRAYYPYKRLTPGARLTGFIPGVRD